MPILPSGGGYPGIIGEAELIASAVASVAADKAASTAAAADALSARTAAQSDAGLALSARNAAQSDAGLALSARESAASAAADVSAAKAQAEADAGTVAGLVPGAQQDAADVADAKAQALAAAGTVADLVAPAQTNAQTIADIVAPAQADASAVSRYAATAAAAVADMAVAPLDSIATSAQVVRGSDLRLGLRGGVALTVSATTGFTPVSTVAATTVGVECTFPATGYLMRFGAPWNDGCVGISCNANGTLNVFEGFNAEAFQHTGTLAVPSGARWLWFVDGGSTFSIYFDAAASPAATYTRKTSAARGLLGALGGLVGAAGFVGTIRAAVALNFAATQADRIAAMRGEYPQAWLGGVASYANTGAWTETNNPVAAGVTINTNAGGVLDVASVAAAGYYFQFASGASNTAPLLQQGRVVRLRYSLTVASGTVRVLPFNAASTEGYRTGLVTLAAGTDMVVDLPVNVSRSSGGGVGLKLMFDSAVFVLSNVSIEILGAQVLVGPQDWTRTRGVDMSGNCNDLVYGTGVLAIEPATKARVIQATAAGATVSAGAVATVGTLSGATYRDTKAIAAMRQWDSVSANWRQARPANCAALQAAVTANGTPLVEATALASGSCPVSANAPINLIHTIN